MVRMRTQCGKVSNDELLRRKSSVDEVRRRTGTVSTGSPTPLGYVAGSAAERGRNRRFCACLISVSLCAPMNGK